MAYRTIDSVSKRIRQKKEKTIPNVFSNVKPSRGIKGFALKPRLKKQHLQKLSSAYLMMLMIFQSLAGVFVWVPKGNEAKGANNSWASFTTDYIYDNDKIYISSESAQLKALDNWYDTKWLYRKSITINNTSGAGSLTDYQVKVVLDSSNFNFGRALSDGSDIRVTDSDGRTIIPYFIENYDSTGKSSTIWIKVPDIPAASNKVVFMYYGNSSPTSFDVPPVGPFQKYSTNPVISASGLLAENIVYDDATNKYWMVFSNFNNNSIGLAYSADLVSWFLYENNPIFSTGDGQLSPHLLKYNNTWYLYYAKGSSPNVKIYVATSNSVTGPYSANESTPMLSPGISGSWESSRVLEPYVFHDDDGTWRMLYMGDSGSTTEQIGYATASSPNGPWTKSSLNPVIPFGASGAYDAGTVADPMIYKMNGTYYITYAASSTKLRPWIEAYATTNDFVTFKKQNIILGEGDDGTWDRGNAHRGAISRFGDYYYFSYTGYDGDNYRMGLAKQYAKNTAQGFPPEQVFDFYDDFSSPVLQSQFRQRGGTGGTYSISDGILELKSGLGTQNRILSIQQFDNNKGYVMEAKTQHQNADGTGNHSSGIGFCDKNFIFSAWKKGKFELGFSGNGNNFMRIKNSPSLAINDKITVEAWINPSSTDVYQGVVSKRDANTNAANYILYVSGNQIKFGFYNGSWKLHTTTSANLQLNQWYHIAGVFDNTTHNIKIFVNGQKMLDEAETSSMIMDSNDVMIGNGNYNAQYFKGIIDEVRISNDIRYTTDFSVPTSSFSTDGNTVGLWHFDEMDNTAYDATDNNNDGKEEGVNSGMAIYDGYGSNWLKFPFANSVADNNNMSQFIDSNWHTQRVWWKSPSDARYQNDDNPWEIVTSNISTTPLNIFFASSSSTTYSTDLNVDWVKVRKYVDNEPSIIVKEEAGYYSLNDSTIQPPVTDKLDFTSISSFTETTTKNGGEIKYILSNDAGTNWIYYNGSGWVASNGTYSQSNTAYEINSNISTFPIGGGKFLWRAFLHSDGAQQVRLSQIEIEYLAGGSAFIAPSKPSVDNISISNNNSFLSFTNLPSNITHIAISTSKDFDNTSWEDIAKKEELLKQYANQKEIYIKLRTNDGAVSDIITYNPQTQGNDQNNNNNPTPLQDGDIVKTPSSPDIYVIKTQNNKKYKRLILSPNVFNSYHHLKWENIKTITEEQLNQYQTSSLVKELTDTIVYTLTPDGDTGKRKPFDITQTYDPDSIYTINKVDRDSYEWEE